MNYRKKTGFDFAQPWLIKRNRDLRWLSEVVGIASLLRENQTHRYLVCYFNVSPMPKTLVQLRPFVEVHPFDIAQSECQNHPKIHHSDKPEEWLASSRIL